MLSLFSCDGPASAKERQTGYVFEKGKEKELKRLHRSATKIQSVFRGHRGRERFKQLEPQLRKALKARAFCVECEINVATKRCRECKDQYCDKCFDIVHRKGKRKTHGWEPTRRDGGGGGYKQTTTAAVNYGLDNPNLWEEYWDDNAQANYWYHTLTGEATWICPY
jgi:hypothetical protein